MRHAQAKCEAQQRAQRTCSLARWERYSTAPPCGLRPQLDGIDRHRRVTARAACQMHQISALPLLVAACALVEGPT